MANLKKVDADNPRTVDKNGRPVYDQGPDLQPEIDRKREALEAKIEEMNKQDEEARKAYPPAPGVKKIL